MMRRSIILFGVLAVCWQVGCKESNKYDRFLFSVCVCVIVVPYHHNTHDKGPNVDLYTLVRLFPYTNSQIEYLRHLENSVHNFEFLKRSRGLNDSTDILVPNDRLSLVEFFAYAEEIPYDAKQNYGRSFESVDRSSRRLLRNFNIYEYHSYAAILDYLDTLASRHPDVVKVENLGKSFQGRRMKLVKISQDHSAGNPIIFIDAVLLTSTEKYKNHFKRLIRSGTAVPFGFAGIHAREWVAPAMAMYLIHRLVNDPEARKKELAGVDWYILPVVNPDGYEFTRASKTNRMWRKTRSKSPSYDCYGVDGNRNYGFKWAVSGVSTNPCDRETYAGPKPFSEPETQMVRNVMMDNAKRMKLYVSLHSYGQYLVYPWGYTGEFIPKEWKKLDILARQVSDAVERAGGKPFRVMSAGQWYPAAGGSDDFAFGAIGVPYSYTMELTDGHEFLFPEYLLRQVLPQFYEGFKIFGAQIQKEFRNSWF